MTDTLPTPFKKYTFEDVLYMAATIYGEARGEVYKGKLAVGWAIRNRAEIGGWFGQGIKGVCLRPFQFSCWNHADPNYYMCNEIAKEFDRYSNDLVVQECLTAALLVLTGRVRDDTKGSTHYHVRKMKSRPTWSRGLEPAAEIGNHIFFNNVK